MLPDEFMKNGTLNFIIGDHASTMLSTSLGSTSIVTDDEGTVISETKYKAWGEVRYTSGANPTEYTYTGQYSYTNDFGLMFYNARWYDSSLSRFAQADTIVPNPRNVQAWDRYIYSGNNPIRYTDPSGHCWFCVPAAIGIGVGTIVAAGALAADLFLNTPPTKGPSIPLPQKRNMTSWVVDRINQDTTSPITKALKNNFQSSNLIQKAGAVKAWVGLVQEGGAWDYKKEINQSGIPQANPNIKIGDITTNYQAVANMTYGILAAEIGLPQGIAETGAGIAQIQNNYHLETPFDFSGVGGVDTNFDDPFDNYWIRFGYEFQKNHGDEFGSITPETLTTSINEFIAQNGEPPKPLKPGN